MDTNSNLYLGGKKKKKKENAHTIHTYRSSWELCRAVGLGGSLARETDPSRSHICRFLAATLPGQVQAGRKAGLGSLQSRAPSPRGQLAALSVEVPANPPAGRPPQTPEPTPPRNTVTHRGHRGHRPNQNHVDLWGHRGCESHRQEKWGRGLAPEPWLLQSAPSSHLLSHAGASVQRATPSEPRGGSMCLSDEYLPSPGTQWLSINTHLKADYRSVAV